MQAYEETLQQAMDLTDKIHTLSTAEQEVLFSKVTARLQHAIER